MPRVAARPGLDLRALASLSPELREQVAALVASEARLRQIVDDQTELVCRFFPDTVLTYVNPAYCAYYGRTDAELLGRSFRSFVPPEAQWHIDRMLAEITAERPSWSHEHQVRRADGALRWVRWIDRAVVEDRDGNILEYQATGQDVTERHEREAERAASARLAAALDEAREGVILLDAEDRVVSWNRAYTTIRGPLASIIAPGVPFETLLRRSIEIGAVLDAIGREEEWLRERMAAHRALADIPDQYRADRGQWLETRASRLPDGGTLFVLRDITARKLADESLRESERRYRALANLSPSGLIRSDRSGTVKFTSERASVLAGVSITESPDGWFRAVHPEDRERVEAEWWAAHAVGRMYVGEFRFLHSGGRSVWVLMQSIAEQDEQGDTLGFVSTVTDITGRKTADLALRESEARFRDFTESAADWAWETDAEDRMSFLSGGFEVATGIPRAEILGRNRREVNIALGAEPAAAAAHSAATVGRRVWRDAELEWRLPDGRLKHILSSARPIFDAKGDYAGVRGTARDVTAVREAERERRRLEEQLRHAQRLEAVGQLAGGLAHDLNNILGSVLGFSSLALRHRSAVPEQVAGYLDEIRVAGQRASALVRDMLLFSRGNPANRSAQPLAPIVEETLGLLSSSLPAGVRVDFEPRGDEVPVDVDSGQMQQVLMNLCLNAVDAQCGRGRISVALRSAVESGRPCASCGEPVTGGSVVLEVRDRGSGVPGDVLEHVFEPFYSTKDVGKGSGLGLSVVHGIVHEHGGHLHLDTGAGGTAFRVLLPALDASPSAAGEGSAEDSPARSGRPGRVLIVEDDPGMAHYLQELLRTEGYDAAVVGEGEQALERLRAAPSTFAAVVTDLTLPGLSGIDVARQVHAVTPRIPIIVCSGRAERMEREDLASLGITAVLGKPIDRAALLRAIAVNLGS